MDKVLLNTILMSTHSGSHSKLTKEFLLNFGFKTATSRIVTYDKDKIRIDIYIDAFGNFDMFTEKVFFCKDHIVKNDWFHPRTIKEFLDIFNEYKKYIQHNS